MSKVIQTCNMDERSNDEKILDSFMDNVGVHKDDLGDKHKKDGYVAYENIKERINTLETNLADAVEALELLMKPDYSNSEERNRYVKAKETLNRIKVVRNEK